MCAQLAPAARPANGRPRVGGAHVGDESGEVAGEPPSARVVVAAVAPGTQVCTDHGRGYPGPGRPMATGSGGEPVCRG